MAVTADNLNTIVQTVVHAHERGFETLVTHKGELGSEQFSLFGELGSHLVEPATGVRDQRDPRSRLVEEARRRGCSGLLFHDARGPVDFQRSETALRTAESYDVDAVAGPSGGIEEMRDGTIAAIPAYNEAGTIGGVVAEAEAFVEQVIVIDDGSSDETTEVARDAGATVIEHSTNGGYGAALQTAFREAYARDAARLVVLDGDGQHDPADIPSLVYRQNETDAAIVIGSRFVNGATCDAPLYRLVGLQVVNVLTNLSSGVGAGDSNSWISDTQSGYRLYSRRAIESLAAEEAIGGSMSASTDILFHARQNDYIIEETGVAVSYDVENPNSQNPVSHGLSLVANILKTVARDRSLLFSSASPRATNALSFDLEHWHSATLLSDEVDDPVDRVEDSVAIVLDLLRRHDVRATFFVVGEIAAEYPELVRGIADEGHEIASHGHTHTPLFELTPDAFENELRRSARVIEDATGSRPRGFRAPNFSVTPATEWAFDVLESTGYRYDSSVFPVKTPMYGVNGASTGPYAVTSDSPFGSRNRDDSLSSGLVEFPLSVASPRVPLPIAGGFYARILPVSVLDRGIRRLNRNGTPANIYFHPWEFNPDVRIDCSLPKRTISFAGIEKTHAKLDRLLAVHEFGTVSSVLAERALLDGADPPSIAFRERSPELNRG